MRRGGAGAGAEICGVGVRGHGAPADEHLAFLGAKRSDGRLAALAFAGIGRQENDAGRELAGRRQRRAQGFLGHSRQELVRQRRDHSGAVAGVRLRAARAAVIHAAQQMIGVLDDLVAAFALDVGHEADAAAVVLELGSIQPLRRREAGVV